MTTAYGNLSLHHSRYVYKRGAYKGDAPADSSNRAKAHFRVIKPNEAYPFDPYLVRFWATNIILAYPDGRIKVNCGGFDNRPTTRKAMNHTLHMCGFRGHLYTRRIGALSQTAISINGKSYRYYDYMEFDAEGTLLTPPREWHAEVMDTALTKAFRAQTKAFWGMFPVLFATRNKDRAFMAGIHRLFNGHAGTGTAYSPDPSVLDNPEHWPLLVSYYTLSYDDDQAKQARAHLMRLCTQHMTKLVDRGVE